MPISRVRELTAANIVLAAANIAPMLRKKAIRTPAALKNRAVRDCVAKNSASGIAASLNWGSSWIVFRSWSRSLALAARSCIVET